MRYAFFGNRAYVLKAMLDAGLNIPHIGAVAGSYAAHFLGEKQIAYTAIADKPSFLAWLSEGAFDVLITNGCPFILPAAALREGVRYINIHPSYLPDLRGADPIPAAILYARDSGATCHMIDAGIDTGDIIAQIKLPYSPEWDATTLYPLCFNAEAEVFRLALARNFAVSHAQKTTSNEIYYSFKPDDLLIDISDSIEAIIRRVRAFNTPNKLARIVRDGKIVRIVSAEIIAAKSPQENIIDIEKKGQILRLSCHPDDIRR